VDFVSPRSSGTQCGSDCVASLLPTPLSVTVVAAKNCGGARRRHQGHGELFDRRLRNVGQTVLNVFKRRSARYPTRSVQTTSRVPGDGVDASTNFFRCYDGYGKRRRSREGTQSSRTGPEEPGETKSTVRGVWEANVNYYSWQGFQSDQPGAGLLITPKTKVRNLSLSGASFWLRINGFDFKRSVLH